MAMAWIDYRKAYDMVPHSWIKECLEMLGIDEGVRELLEESMKTWRVELTCGNENLGEVSIKRGIFQGDSLSPLLFVACLIPMTYVLRKCGAGYDFSSNGQKINHLLFMDDLKLYAKSEKALDSLVQTVRLFSSDIGMEFGIDKCAVLIVKNGKVRETEGIVLPNGEVLKGMEEGDSYKYLGILEADEMKHKEMKENVKKEYLRRIRKVLESKLNGGNVIMAMNTWAVSLVRYSAAFIEWTGTELEGLDRKTRKVMTMHGALHPKSDVDRLYLPRKEGGRGLISIEDTVAVAVAGLESYVKESTESLLTAARLVDGDLSDVVPPKDVKKQRKSKRMEKWKKKKLHGQFVRETEDIGGEKRWIWLKDGSIKRETETLILAAQEQSLRTNAIKAKIDRSQEDSKCRMCKKSEETVAHIVSGCSKLAQHDYKRRHDWVGKRIHWEVCKRYGIKVTAKWYEHKPEAVVENDQCKVLWDFLVQTDHVIGARRPDMIVINKEKKTCQIIDFAIPLDSNVNVKEMEKIGKYQDLARELKRIWNLKTQIIPVVIGALGTIPKTLVQWLECIGIGPKMCDLQKSVILNSARILRKVLEI